MTTGSAVRPWTLRVRRVPGAPVVAARCTLRGGARIEEIPGQVSVTGRLLTEGTTRRSWDRIAEQAEDLGMLLGSSGTFEGHGLSVDALAEDWRHALDGLAELLLDSTFPEDRCHWLCRQTAAELESLGDQPDVRTSWGFLEQLYTPHPRARPVQGTTEGLARLGAEDCAGFHRRALDRGFVLAVAGDLDEDQVRAHAQALLGAETTAAVTGEQPVAPVGLAEPRREVVVAGDQAHLFAGGLSVTRDHADATALEVLAVILGAGSGLSGRLPTRIREREGLAYSTQVATLAGAGFDRGRWMVYVGTSPSTVAQAERAVREELARLLEDGVSEEEVADARAYLVGREAFRRETARQWATLMLEAELYGRPFDQPEWCLEQLEAVDRERIETVARRHLRLEELKVTVGRPRGS
ncbi:MAG: insulinase family protein [Acidobacteria bacterium]|nr:insulinase family protein [Acidobacteriota bacterium]